MTDTSKYIVEELNEFSNLTLNNGLNVTQGKVKIDTSTAANSATAAIDLSGGMKIGKNIIVGGSATISGNLIVEGNTS